MIVENHASFILSSKVRSAAEITQVLDIQPTESHEIGDARVRRDGTPVQHPPFEWDWTVWELSADDDAESDDKSGTRSIAMVVAPLVERIAELDTLRSDCNFHLSWWGDSPSSQGGLVLPEGLLAQLAILRCPVYMTAYTNEYPDAP